ncbi:DNA-deoxyinosine glycosylase [Olsenella sp. An270]|uniref:DNA-deoxyinosine glycosylase n=1 Tax=Olsenella sp. An270 TaxID=1965615 RepID=UPI000B377DE2|nr:DNA-deoxyinosine glycosylase [Olsenella sp. An270]OUO60490.1 DNA-deoxyinosine glycosylase [Olsenella sp. An270]
MADYQRISHGFEPIFDERSRVLVLGSFPSVLSRENRFYYGNLRNRFWRVMADVLGETEPAADDIAAKRAMLLRHGIALWDVIESCEVRGSSDASIRDVVPADVARITRVAPVRAVVCNGGTAGRLYRRWLEPVTGLAAEVLPSTSPANAAWSLPRLTERWREVLLAALATK